MRHEAVYEKGNLFKFILNYPCTATQRTEKLWASQTYTEGCSILKSAAFVFLLKSLVYLYIDQTFLKFLSAILFNAAQHTCQNQNYVESISILASSPEKCINNAIKAF